MRRVCIDRDTQRPLALRNHRRRGTRFRLGGLMSSRLHGMMTNCDWEQGTGPPFLNSGSAAAACPKHSYQSVVQTRAFNSQILHG